MEVKKHFIPMTEDQIESAAGCLADLIVDYLQGKDSIESEMENPGDESSPPSLLIRGKSRKNEKK